MATDSQLERRANLIIRSRMARHALPQNEYVIDARTGLTLAKAGVSKFPESNPISASVLVKLQDASHEQREDKACDPLVLLLNESEPRLLIELDKAVLNPSSDVRSVVLSEIKCKIAANINFCSERTRSVISEFGKAVMSEDSSVYIPACVEIHDAMKTDILYNLGVLTHASNIQALELVHEYLNRLLRPTRSGMKFMVDLALVRALKDPDSLVSSIQSIVDTSSTVEELLEKYFDICGFVPLSGEYACNAVLSRWRVTHPEIQVDWLQLENWANAHGSVLANYQICQATINNHDIINSDEANDSLNGRIQEILNSGKEEQQLNSWTLRQTLARYYCQDLMCEFPLGETEQICIAAWWLADQLASAIETGRKDCSEYCMRRLTETAAALQELWLLVQPSGIPSVLHTATMLYRNLWSESLASMLSAQIVNDGKTMLSGKAADSLLYASFRGAMCAHRPKKDHLSYAFTTDVLPFLEEINKAFSETKNSQKMQSISELAKVVRSVERLQDSLINLATQDAETRQAISFAVFVGAYSGEENADVLWECVSDSNWFQTVITTVDIDDLSMLCEACIRYQVASIDIDRRVMLPHYFAIAAIKCSDDDSRLPFLVGYCIVSSIAVGSTSAISRLVSESSRGSIVEQLINWHKRIEEIIRFARPLAAARLRPAKQALSFATANLSSL